MATTLQDLRNLCYDVLREEENTSAYPLVFMDALINSAQNRICNGTVINPITKEAIKKGQLPFLGSSKFYSNINVTTLSADAIVSDTVLDITDTTDFPSSGILYIAGNIVTYTGKTSATFTGCSNVLFAHLAGTQVSVIFSLPTDYGSILNVTYANNFKLEPKLYDDIWEDLNSYKNGGYNRTDANGYRSQTTVKPFYTIIDGQYILVFNRNNTGDQIHVRYEKKATRMTASTDNSTITDDTYAQSTIPYLAIGEMLYSRGEEQRAAELINFAIGQLKEMYTFYNSQNYENISGVQYKIGKGKLNI